MIFMPALINLMEVEAMINFQQYYFLALRPESSRYEDDTEMLLRRYKGGTKTLLRRYLDAM